MCVDITQKITCIRLQLVKLKNVNDYLKINNTITWIFYTTNKKQFHPNKTNK